MTVIYRKRAASVAQTCDGAFGFNDGSADYIVGGWIGSTNSLKTFWKSTNGGATFEAQSDFDHKFHTGATCVVNGIAYLVGGDVYSPINEGDFIVESHKFESGAWSQVAADCGVGDRCIGALVELNGDFYHIGGQYDITKASAFNTILKSTDNCVTFTSLVADTTVSTVGFYGGLTWGACVAYRDLLWRICGGVYTDDPYRRGYDNTIYSSPDGLNWTNRGYFRGIGRNYPQLVVYNDKMWLLGGFCDFYSLNNISDVWSIELQASGRLKQVYHGEPDYGDRHAHSAWTTDDGIMVFAGSSDGAGTNSDCWLIQER